MDKDTKIGPLANKKGLERVQKQLEQGLKEGAKLLQGGKRLESEGFKDGNYFEPAVVEGTPDNILAKEEVFGPIFYLMKFKEREEALEIANSSDYGLSGVVFGSDGEKTYDFADKTKVGAIFINSVSQSDSKLPSGGVKLSGYGRECGVHGAHEFCNIKAVWIK